MSVYRVHIQTWGYLFYNLHVGWKEREEKKNPGFHFSHPKTGCSSLLKDPTQFPAETICRAHHSPGHTWPGTPNL